MESLLLSHRPIWMLIVTLLIGSTLSTSAALTPVDTEDEAALEASASLAFYEYLQAIEEGELAQAYEMVLDPVDMAAQDDVLNRLSTFIKARQKNPVSNEAMIVRSAGDWALVVYQYDTTIAGKAARVITTAWMLQWEGFWRQFIVAPEDEQFWDTYRSDYELLQNWFDEHAEDIGSA
jgi:hypothetical protein